MYFTQLYANPTQAEADIRAYDNEQTIFNVAAIEWLLRALTGTKLAPLDVADWLGDTK